MRRSWRMVLPRCPAMRVAVLRRGERRRVHRRTLLLVVRLVLRRSRISPSRLFVVVVLLLLVRRRLLLLVLLVVLLVLLLLPGLYGLNPGRLVSVHGVYGANQRLSGACIEEERLLSPSSAI
jgi:hypothetical protein